MPRVLVLGWDCVPPALAFERYLPHMPHLAGLMARGSFGPLRSTFPPITLPAWASMVSGKDPGELGIYGFRTRPAGTYGMQLQDATALRVPRVWDLLAAAGYATSALFVPPSYPPVGPGGAPAEGTVIGCFLTPGPEADYARPAHLKGELSARFGPYVPDIAHVGARADLALLQQLEAMTRQHCAMARYVWESREPDFQMAVCIGPDRFHHAFYRLLDPAHPEFVEDVALGDVGARFYRMLDAELGATLAELDDDTVVLIASDHGARPLEGAFRINAWLEREGYLRFRTRPADGAQVRDHIDWSATRAWAEGGYYARVFLNVRGREPAGVLPAERLDAEREALRSRLQAVRGPAGERWENRVQTPESLYGATQGDPPDLLAVFDDLRVRPLATLSGDDLYAAGDDRGHDACNHHWDGIFVLAGPGVPQRGLVHGAEIYDVGATVLSSFDVAPPPGFRGRDLRSLA